MGLVGIALCALGFALIFHAIARGFGRRASERLAAAGAALSVVGTLALGAEVAVFLVGAR